jgi:hypothetical protein
MIQDATELSSLSEQNENVIRDYFEARPGWTVTRLDWGKERAADFRVCDNDSCCILCEVKTIGSVRANFPFPSLDSYLERRTKRQDEVKKWIEENPGKRLILRSDKREFIYGDESEFAKKYRGRPRNTEQGFKGFAKAMQDYFSNSSIKDLPYILRLDSDDLYIPSLRLRERETFFKWLENEIIAISRGEPSRHWNVHKWSELTASYSTSYPIHKPTHENDVKAEYQLMVVGPGEGGTGPLEVDIHSYGVLNLERITSNVESGLEQLQSSASREEDQQIPRIIALAFESGIGLEWKELFSHITWLLESHPNLSAIAVLAWISYNVTTPVVPRFVVYHNSWLQTVKPLPVNAFSDKWSVQLSPVKTP